MALEALAINLIASGLAKGGQSSAKKVKRLLQGKQYSEDLDRLETEFNRSLQTKVMEAIDDIDRLDAEQIEASWGDIAQELTDIQVIFKSEQAAVQQLTSAIAAGVGYDLDSDQELQESLTAAVAAAYRDVLRTFEREVSGTELADMLSHEADIHLSRNVDELATHIEELEKHQHQLQAVALRDEGFIHLSPSYFEQQSATAPERCWRTGFDLIDVYEGHAAQRKAAQEDGTKYCVADRLFSRLDVGTDCALLGTPGAGKSTICKQVACQWYDRRGTVFYRDGDRTQPLTNWGALAEYLRTISGPALVVVENAIREEAVEIFNVIKEFQSDDSVTFLLDARESEWHSTDTILSDPRLQDIKTSRIETHSVPDIDNQDCDRIVQFFESITNSAISESPEVLMEDIQSDAGTGAMIRLSYHLVFYTIEDVTNTATNTTVLESSVERALSTMQDHSEDELALQVSLLANLLNAADVGVYPELLYGIGDSTDKFRAITRVLKRMERRQIFTPDGQAIGDVIEPLQMNHTLWSELYLQKAIDSLGKRQVTRLSEQCLDWIFEVADSQDRQHEINRWFRQKMPFFEEISDRPAETGDRLVEHLFRLGLRRPVLAPYFGRTVFTHIEIPAVCSTDIPIRVMLWRGMMQYRAGNLEVARDEFEQTIDRIDDGVLSEQHETEIRAQCAEYMGRLKLDEGKTEEALTQFRSAAELYEQIGDSVGQGQASLGIGRTHRELGDPDKATEALTDAKEQFEAEHTPRQQARCLNLLGLVARDRGELERAKTYHEQSRAIALDVTDRRIEVRSLNHLGVIHQNQGASEVERSCFLRGLKLARQIGDKQGESYILHNLGESARRKGQLATAEEYFEASLQLEQDIGNRRMEALCNMSLGEVYREMGEIDEAEAAFERGQGIIEEIGDDRRTAEFIMNRGLAAKDRGHNEQANDLLTESRNRFDTIGDKRNKAKVLVELGSLARSNDRPDHAKEQYQAALRTAEAIGAKEIEVRAYGGLGAVARCHGEITQAMECFQQSLTVAKHNNDERGEAYIRRQMGDIARDQCAFDDARAHYKQSLDHYETIGTVRRQAELHQCLGELAIFTGEYDEAKSQLGRACETFQNVGDVRGTHRTRLSMLWLATIRDDANRERKLIDSLTTDIDHPQILRQVLRDFNRVVTKVKSDQTADSQHSILQRVIENADNLDFCL